MQTASLWNTGNLPRAHRFVAHAAALVCAGIMPAQTAFAQGQMDVEGTLASSCTLSSNNLMVRTTIGLDGRVVPPAQTSWTTTGWSCNAGTNITVSATALRLTDARAALPPGLSQTINYTASASGWAPAPATIRTGETTGFGSLTLYDGAPQLQTSPKAGNILVSVSDFLMAGAHNPKQPAKLVQGDYSGTITVTLKVNN